MATLSPCRAFGIDGRDPMRLLTYNIHKGIGGRDRLYRLDRICQVIEEQNPDLICLQEVTRNARRTRFDDQPRILAKYFNARAQAFQMNVHYRRGGYGNLLLSRWPFHLKHHVSLRMGDRKPRGAQVVVIETPEGPLLVTHWHLGLAEKERHWQARHLLHHSSFRESSHLPALVVGDCNDWRNTLWRGSLGEYSFHQVTGPPSRFRSFPAYFSLLSLDKAFQRGGVEARHVRVVRTPLARVASDHLPVVVDFHIDRHSRPALP